jgi:serine/threonine protein kinase
MQSTSSPLYKEIQGHFSLQQRFGQGSYGEVYKAEHNKSGRIVAIKKVFKGAQNLAKHMPEIRAMKGCVSPHIVAYYGCEWLREDLLVRKENKR